MFWFFLVIIVMEKLNCFGMINFYKIILSYVEYLYFLKNLLVNNFIILFSSYLNVKISLINIYLR